MQLLKTLFDFGLYASIRLFLAVLALFFLANAIFQQPGDLTKDRFAFFLEF
jgi:hypothetical protein